MDINDVSLPEFARWLRRQVNRRGWSGAELARRAEVSPATATRWLNGERMPREGKHIHQLAIALNVHQDEILEQLDMRDGGADRMSLAVRRLQPLIDSVQWNEGTFRLVESTLENLRLMQSDEYKVPTASWEEE